MKNEQDSKSPAIQPLPPATGSAAYWEQQRAARINAHPGDLFDFGRCNMGRDQLILPVKDRTATQVICSDGVRTERFMAVSGKRVGSYSRQVVRFVPPNDRAMPRRTNNATNSMKTPPGVGISDLL